MSRFHIIEHPLIARKMSVLRDRETKTPLLRQTLLEVADCHQSNASNPCLASILRADNGLAEALLTFFLRHRLGIWAWPEMMKPCSQKNILPSCQAIFLCVGSFLLIQC